MSIQRRDADYLSDMIEASIRIANYTSRLDYDKFVSDEKTQDAVIRNLQLIGEAARKVSTDMTRQQPLIPWKEIRGMRNIVVHEYFGLNIDVVWTVVYVDLPELLPNLQAIKT